MGKNKGGPLHCLAWGMHIVYLPSNVFHHHSTSIWLAYIPACVLSHVGPLWEFNSVVIMMVGSPPSWHGALLPPSRYYYCHLRGQIWPRWPSDLSEAYVLRGHTATAHTLRCDVCMYEYCDISACFLVMLCDCDCMCEAADSHVQLKQTWFQTVEVLLAHFVMSLLGEAAGVDIRVALRVNAL